MSSLGDKLKSPKNYEPEVDLQDHNPLIRCYKPIVQFEEKQKVFFISHFVLVNISCETVVLRHLKTIQVFKLSWFPLARTSNRVRGN